MTDELIVLRVKGEASDAEGDVKELITLVKRLGTQAKTTSRDTQRSERTQQQSIKQTLRAEQQRARQLRQSGATYREVGKQMGISATKARQLATAERTLDRQNRTTSRSTKQLDRDNRTLGTSFTRVAKFAGAAAASYVGISAARGAVTATTDLAKATLTLTKNLGLGARTASEFSALAFTRGADARSLGMAFNTLSGQVRGARNESKSSIKIFDGLGISMEQLRSSSPEEMLFAVSDGLKDLGPGFARADAQRKLFGRGAATLTPLLRSGSAELRTQLSDARELGATFSKLGLEDMEDVIAAERRLQLAQLGLKISFTQAVAPAIEAVTGELAEMGKILNDPRLSADEKADAIADRFAKLTEKLAEQAAERAPQIALAFVKGFVQAPIWAQVVTSGLLFARMGGIGAFAKMGGEAGTGFGKGFAGKAVPAAAAGAIGLQLRDQIKNAMESEGGIWADLSKADDKIFDLSSNVAALNPLGAAKKNLEGLLELGDDGPSSAETALGRLKDRLDAINPSVRKLAGNTDAQMDKIQESIEHAGEAGSGSIGKQFDKIVRNIRTSMKQGEISTKDGMEAIKAVLREKNAQLAQIGAGGKFTDSKASGSGGGGGGGGSWPGSQRGGIPGFAGIIPGSGSGDKVPLQAMVEPGEGVFIMNRNAMAALTEINSAVPRFATGGAMIAGKQSAKNFDPSLPKFSGSGFPALGTIAGEMNEISGSYERLLRQAAQRAARRGAGAGGPAGKTRSYPHLSGDTDFLPALGNALSDLAKAAGTNISVTSGWRSYEEQAELYRRYKAGTGNLAAPPGQSNHEDGRAADISPGSETLGSLAGRFGLGFPVAGESWHVELMQHGGALARLAAGGAVPPPKHGDRWAKVLASDSPGGRQVTVDEGATLLWQSGLSMGEAAELARVIPGESGGNHRASNPSGARGLFQIMTPLHNEIVNRYGGNVWDPRTNALSAVEIFRGAGGSFAPWEAARSGPPGKILREMVMAEKQKQDGKTGGKAITPKGWSGPNPATMPIAKWNALPDKRRMKLGEKFLKAGGRLGPDRKRFEDWSMRRRKTDAAAKPGAAGTDTTASDAAQTAYDFALQQYQEMVGLVGEASRLYSADRQTSMRLTPVVEGFAKAHGIGLYGPYADVPKLNVPNIGPPPTMGGSVGGESQVVSKQPNVVINMKGDIGKHVKWSVKRGIKTADKKHGRMSRRISYSPGG